MSDLIQQLESISHVDESVLGGWVDPYPHPVLEEHEGVVVVRDDLIKHGSKVRFADFLIGHYEPTAHIKEWVYSAPATGYAQISLPAVCSRYGKSVVIFMADRDRNNLHDYQRRGMEAGAIYKWVKMGMRAVTEKRAKDYVSEDPSTRMLIPMGLDHITVLASVARVARSLPIKPDFVWSALSSGTLSRGMQSAWPEAEFHGVSVGHRPTPRESGRAKVYHSKYAFDRPVVPSEMPPFPSAPTYDAKVWSVMQEWRKSTSPKGTVLFWNVGF